MSLFVLFSFILSLVNYSI